MSDLPISRILPDEAVFALIDAAKEPPEKRVAMVDNTIKYIKKKWPQFFYSPDQARAREEAYAIRLEKRREELLKKYSGRSFLKRNIK